MSLRDDVETIIIEARYTDSHDCFTLSLEEAVDAILSLPELVDLQRKADQWDALGYVTAYVKPDRYEEFVRKAGLWDKVVEIAEADCYDGCPIYDRCYSHECDLAYIVDLLETDS